MRYPRILTAPVDGDGMMSDAVEERVNIPDWSRSDLYAAIRRDTRAGVAADREAHRDYMTEGLNETLDLLERTAQSLRRTRCRP
jgi:hypothetical protein